MVQNAALEVTKQTRDTGGGAVGLRYHSLRNSGTVIFEPFEVALRDWMRWHARETYELLTQSIGNAARGQLHIALDTLGALGNLAIHNAEAALDGFEQYITPGWDGEDAAALHPSDLDFARNLLREIGPYMGKPDAAPGADGSICMEWIAGTEYGFNKMFLDIGPGDRVLTYARFGDRQGIERHFRKNDPVLMTYLHGLVSAFSAK